MQIEQCLEKVLSVIKPIVDTEIIRIEECCGRVLAEDIVAPIGVPEFNRSAMDGYAVFSQDTAGATKEKPLELTVVEKIFAGDYPQITYKKGTCVRVMTGAYIPDGYDSVIRQEDTDYGTNTVRIYKGTNTFENYSKAGEDIAIGTLVLKDNTTLTYLHTGILASLGIDKISVRKKAKVSIISTGSELMNPGEKLEPGKIYGSIGHMLSSAIRNQNFNVTMNKLCGDDSAEAMTLLKEAIEESDFVITTGAVSVGKRDFMPAMLKEAGATILFQGADIQPGTPTMASLLEGKVILSLSGNPYAALANFEIYFWEAMAKMTGMDCLKPLIETVELADSYNKINKRRRLIRAKVVGSKVYLPTESHAASVINNMTDCNCFVDLEAERAVKIGDKVTIRHIKGL